MKAETYIIKCIFFLGKKEKKRKGSNLFCKLQCFTGISTTEKKIHLTGLLHEYQKRNYLYLLTLMYYTYFLLSTVVDFVEWQCHAFPCHVNQEKGSTIIFGVPAINILSEPAV